MPSATAKTLSGPERHLALRFSYGLTPALRRDIRKVGHATWFDNLAKWWPSLARSPQDLWQRTQTEVAPGWQVMEDYQRWVLLRRVTSRRQVREIMAEFWENHFHVPVDADGVSVDASHVFPGFVGAPMGVVAPRAT